MTDVIEAHIKNARITPWSGSAVVQEVMGMKAGPVRRLLKDLVGDPIEAPSDHIVARLVTAKLVMVEFNHRKSCLTADLEDREAPINPKLMKGKEWTSLLPFNLQDYQEALEYANQNAVHYRGIEPEGEEGEEQPTRGRKGGTFAKVQEYMLDNPETFDKANKADAVAKKIAEELDVPETTTVQYVYKCRRLRKQGEI